MLESCLLYTVSFLHWELFFSLPKRRSKALFIMQFWLIDTGRNKGSFSWWRNSVGSLHRSGYIAHSAVRTSMCSTVSGPCSSLAARSTYVGLLSSPSSSSPSTSPSPSSSHNAIISPELQSCENIIIILVYVPTMRSLYRSSSMCFLLPWHVCVCNAVRWSQ